VYIADCPGLCGSHVGRAAAGDRARAHESKLDPAAAARRRRQCPDGLSSILLLRVLRVIVLGITGRALLCRSRRPLGAVLPVAARRVENVARARALRHGARRTRRAVGDGRRQRGIELVLVVWIFVRWILVLVIGVGALGGGHRAARATRARRAAGTMRVMGLTASKGKHIFFMTRLRVMCRLFASLGVIPDFIHCPRFFRMLDLFSVFSISTRPPNLRPTFPPSFSARAPGVCALPVLRRLAVAAASAGSVVGRRRRRQRGRAAHHHARRRRRRFRHGGQDAKTIIHCHPTRANILTHHAISFNHTHKRHFVSGRASEQYLYKDFQAQFETTALNHPAFSHLIVDYICHIGCFAGGGGMGGGGMGGGGPAMRGGRGLGAARAAGAGGLAAMAASRLGGLGLSGAPRSIFSFSDTLVGVSIDFVVSDHMSDHLSSRITP
jgi:hypothetical protein